MTNWFYSDPHFGHANILRPDRPNNRSWRFTSVDAMNEELVERHNARVKPSDIVYCLGDFALHKGEVEKWAPRLHGRKRLILGNHDLFGAALYLRFFEDVMSYQILDGMLFSHIPIAPWSMGAARVNVHGHCHLSRPLFYHVSDPHEIGFVKQRAYINISVERTNYQPVSLEQLQEWSRA